MEVGDEVIDDVVNDIGEFIDEMRFEKIIVEEGMEIEEETPDID